MRDKQTHCLNRETADLFISIRTVRETLPDALSWEVIKTATRQDKSLHMLEEAIRTRKPCPQHPTMAPYAKIYEELTTHDGVLIRGHRVVLPAALQQTAIQLSHAGHVGPKTTISHLRERCKIVKVAHTATLEGKDPRREVFKMVMMHNSTAHTTTHIPPAQGLMGRKIKTLIPTVHTGAPSTQHQLLVDRTEQAKKKNKQYRDTKKRSKTTPITQGDTVLITQQKPLGTQQHTLSGPDRAGASP